jgi:hypothetical protein
MKKAVRIHNWIFFIAIVLSAGSLPAFSADDQGQYQVRAIDNVDSCAALNTALAKAKDDDDWRQLYGFSVYTMGYLTAVNRFAQETYDVGGKKNTKTLMIWLERYCAQHPSDSFNNALYRMVAEIFPIRTRQAPE